MVVKIQFHFISPEDNLGIFIHLIFPGFENLIQNQKRIVLFHMEKLGLLVIGRTGLQTFMDLTGLRPKSLSKILHSCTVSKSSDFIVGHNRSGM